MNGVFYVSAKMIKPNLKEKPQSVIRNYFQIFFVKKNEMAFI